MTTIQSTQNDPPANIENYINKVASELHLLIDEGITKMKRNVEHNGQVFQEKANAVLLKLDQAYEQIDRVLAQIDPHTEDFKELSRQEPSIALSENSADVTLDSLNQQ